VISINYSPVKGIPLYLSIDVIDYFRSLFEYSELTICQRIKEAEYYALANSIRKKTKKDREILNRCVNIDIKQKIYQEDCLHLFAWNQFVDEHNGNMLRLKCTNIVDIPANKTNSIQKIFNTKAKKNFLHTIIKI
jgi:hypothetical protein